MHQTWGLFSGFVFSRSSSKNKALWGFSSLLAVALSKWKQTNKVKRKKQKTNKQYLFRHSPVQYVWGSKNKQINNMKTNLTSSASSYFKKDKHTNKNAEWKKTSKQNQKGVSWLSEIASIQKSTEKLHNKMFYDFSISDIISSFPTHSSHPPNYISCTTRHYFGDVCHIQWLC